MTDDTVDTRVDFSTTPLAELLREVGKEMTELADEKTVSITEAIATAQGLELLGKALVTNAIGDGVQALAARTLLSSKDETPKEDE